MGLEKVCDVFKTPHPKECRVELRFMVPNSAPDAPPIAEWRWQKMLSLRAMERTAAFVERAFKAPSDERAKREAKKGGAQ